jgi:hypothetical protein
MQDVQTLNAEEKEFRRAFRALIDIVRSLEHKWRLPPGGSTSDSLDSSFLE